MAARKDVVIKPPGGPDGDYPRCTICGWWDRKLRSVGSTLQPEERVAVHSWARHGTPLPPWMTPVKKEGDD